MQPISFLSSYRRSWNRSWMAKPTEHFKNFRYDSEAPIPPSFCASLLDKKSMRYERLGIERGRLLYFVQREILPFQIEYLQRYDLEKTSGTVSCKWRRTKIGHGRKAMLKIRCILVTQVKLLRLNRAALTLCLYFSSEYCRSREVFANFRENYTPHMLRLIL